VVGGGLTYNELLKEMWSRYRDGILIPDRNWLHALEAAELIDSTSGADLEIPNNTKGARFDGAFHIIGDLSFLYRGSIPALYIPVTHLSRRTDVGTELRIIGRAQVDLFLLQEPRLKDVFYAKGIFSSEDGEVLFSVSAWRFIRRSRGEVCKCKAPIDGITL